MTELISSLHSEFVQSTLPISLLNHASLGMSIAQTLQLQKEQLPKEDMAARRPVPLLQQSLNLHKDWADRKHQKPDKAYSHHFSVKENEPYS